MIESPTFRAKRVLDKHPDEDLIREFDFADMLGAGESLLASPVPTVTVDPDSELEVETATITILGTKVVFAITGGIERTKPWAITVTVSVDNGTANQQKYVGEALLRVTKYQES